MGGVGYNGPDSGLVGLGKLYRGRDLRSGGCVERLGAKYRKLRGVAWDIEPDEPTAGARLSRRGDHAAGNLAAEVESGCARLPHRCNEGGGAGEHAAKNGLAPVPGE